MEYTLHALKKSTLASNHGRVMLHDRASHGIHLILEKILSTALTLSVSNSFWTQEDENNLQIHHSSKVSTITKKYPELSLRAQIIPCKIEIPQRSAGGHSDRHIIAEEQEMREPLVDA